ncbi:MAG: rhodanese [Rickettsiales bacterium]|nr:MAG: rhodanese [Rickettsiales bacterium]
MSNQKHIDVTTLHKWLDSKEAILVDVREIVEFSDEKIPGSINVPLGTVSAKNTLLSKYKDKKIVISCRSGARSLSACTKILQDVPSAGLYHLDGGILAWKERGFKTIRKTEILPLERQTQIALGGMIVLGNLLGYFVSFEWNLLSIFVGLGLINSGATGWCGLMKLIACLPWNRQSDQQK